MRRVAIVAALCSICGNFPGPLVAAGSDLKISITSKVVSGPIAQSNPKALPGSIIEYSAQVSYGGDEALGEHSLAITNPIPQSLSLVVSGLDGGVSSPFDFVEGLPPSDLTCLFRSLADRDDCLEFSSNGGVSFDYQPTPDPDGIDPAITHLRFRLRGAMAPAAAEPSYFTLRYRMKVD
ncbi:hypothetical protein EUU23_10425 [Sphingorhabdus sp. IMCC26285]|uniref:DUF4402 domain-containing protein n=1 Tax=Sphingorhabdus profundilacus TaxID=2509718 RepID=A0A6I4LX37_9SPHN|nr:hypothetical protein [Sphingorhabdus profundilacus]MVZ98107.1 hypothetical protein [Sphingorhabdus profundilacus]